MTNILGKSCLLILTATCLLVIFSMDTVSPQEREPELKLGKGWVLHRKPNGVHWYIKESSINAIIDMEPALVQDDGWKTKIYFMGGVLYARRSAKEVAESLVFGDENGDFPGVGVEP